MPRLSASSRRRARRTRPVDPTIRVGVAVGVFVAVLWLAAALLSLFAGGTGGINALDALAIVLAQLAFFRSVSRLR